MTGTAATKASAALRRRLQRAIDRVIARAADHGTVVVDESQGSLYVLELDDHVSDETIAGGRTRIALPRLRSRCVLMVLEDDRTDERDDEGRRRRRRT